MAAKSEPIENFSDREFVISRVFNAPPQVVFSAWTDPRHMANWWGPHGFTNPICEMDVRPGGAFRIVMQGPDGSRHPAKGFFREIVPPQRLVMTIDHSDLPDEWHAMVNPKHIKGQPRPAYEGVTTVTFTEQNGNTALTIRMRFESAAIFNMFMKLGMTQGWTQSLERLEAEVAKTLETARHPTFGHGKICYIEIPAIDIARSAAFYKDVFGWHIRIRDDGSTAFDDGVGEVSGTWFTGRKPATELGLMVYIMVDNAAATVAAIIAHGGKITRPIGADAPLITAKFSDPAGNVLGIYQHPK